MTAQIVYEGKLRTRCTHTQSGTVITTDAPTDNQGLGEAYSPTDLVATALGSCMLTIMGIRAAKIGVDIDGTTVDITKEMVAAPRRIGRIVVEMKMPRGYTEAVQEELYEAAVTCPVYLSLHPDISKVLEVQWGE